jgi:transposase
MSKRNEIRSKIEQAAEQRYRGINWEIIAEAVKRSVKTVQDWPRKHRKEWNRATALAKKKLTDDAVQESVQTLRRQLRLKDDKSSRDAATALIKYAKVEPKTKSPKASRSKPLSATILAMAKYVEGLSDEEITQLLHELAGEESPIPSVAAVETPVESSATRPE